MAILGTLLAQWKWCKRAHNLPVTRLAFEVCNSWNLGGVTSQPWVVHECNCATHSMLYNSKSSNITESQNSWGWNGCLEAIWSNPCWSRATRSRLPGTMSRQLVWWPPRRRLTDSLESLWRCLVRFLFFFFFSFSPGCFLLEIVGTVLGKSSDWVVQEPQWETFAKIPSWPFERFLDLCIHAWLSTFRIQQQYPLDMIFHGFCLSSLELLRCVNVTQLYIYWQDLRHDVEVNYKQVKVGWNSGCCCKVALVIKYSGYCHTWTDCSKVTMPVSNIYDMSCSLLLLDTVSNWWRQGDGYFFKHL